jgi:hypothetical protein
LHPGKSNFQNTAPASCPVQLSREADLPPVTLASRYARTAAPAFAAYRTSARMTINRIRINITSFIMSSFLNYLFMRTAGNSFFRQKVFWIGPYLKPEFQVRGYPGGRESSKSCGDYRDYCRRWSGFVPAGTAPGNLSRCLLIVFALESESFAHFACPKPEEVGLRKAKFFLAGDSPILTGNNPYSPVFTHLNGNGNLPRRWGPRAGAWRAARPLIP